MNYTYLHCLNEKNAEHVDDTVHYLLLIYQNRCKHSKKQLDAGKRKYKTLRPKKPLSSKTNKKFTPITS